uniref:Odorant receptor n=1 Tax=Campoletis chlorideae TaxID=219166 RepID=A0A346D429_9HYME|nr:odorant receptor [Campoletis chlorideae]
MAISVYLLKVFNIFGVWRPDQFQSHFKRLFYLIHTLFIVGTVSTFFISLVINVLLMIEVEIEDFADNTFLLVTIFTSLCKIVSLLIHQRAIESFIDIFNNDVCKPKSIEEIEKQNVSEKNMRLWILFYESFVGLAVVTVVSGSFISRTLPFNAWIPFEHKTFIGFWCAYVHQCFAETCCAAIGSCVDLLFCNLLNLACAQLNILKSRLQSIPSTISEASKDGPLHSESTKDLEARILGKCVRHHLHIIKFVKSVNETFGTVIFIQCAVSTYVLCISTYMITTLPLGSEFSFLIAYMITMLSQIYLYCWHGNELMLQSVNVHNALYAMDWPILTIGTQKKLIMIVSRSFKPLSFQCGGIIVLSLDTYTKLLKLSYSIYNFLKTSE